MTNSSGSSPATDADASKAGKPRKQVRLTGHSADLDRAANAVRGDLADLDLADKVFAPHYARALPMRAYQNVAIQTTPSEASPIAGKLLAGDTFFVLDLSGGWAWGRTAFAVGYVPMAAISG